MDLCRQGIVFSRVEDVLQCLEAAADDPDLEIVRLKNRLDPAFDSRATGGFRSDAHAPRIALCLVSACQPSRRLPVRRPPTPHELCRAMLPH